MATNYEMIEEMAMLVGYEFDGDNLKTFNEWAKEGMVVKKGEKAFMKLDLWKPFTKKLTDEDGKPVIDEKTGKQKEETRFMLKGSALFTPDQVEKGEIKKKPAKKKKAYSKKRKTA
jgi:phage terminase Nu1 subunit (DNA packaging protein)